MQLIDKDSVMALIECGSYDLRQFDDKNAMKKAIDDLPLADPRHFKRGDWVPQSPFTDTLMCSQCKYNIFSEELVTPYCPNCGAVMDLSSFGIDECGEEGEGDDTILMERIDPDGSVHSRTFSIEALIDMGDLFF